MMARRRWPRLASGCSKKPSPSGPRWAMRLVMVARRAASGAPQNPAMPHMVVAAYKARSPRSVRAVDSPDGHGPAALRRHRPHPRRAAPRAPRVVRGDRRARLHRRVVGARPTRRRLHAARAGGRVGADAARRHRHRARRSPAGPALLAQTAASMADAAPGRFALGIGASSPAIVERWNGIPFERRRTARTRDMRALPPPRARRREGHRALRHVRGAGVPARRRARAAAARSSWPPCAPACCGSRARRATARSSTGCRPTTSPRSRPTSATRRSWPGSSWRRPTTSPSCATMAARMITSYLTVDVYAEFQRVARAGPRAPADVGRVGRRRPRPGARARARRGDRRAHRVGHARARSATGSSATRRNGVTTTAPAILGRGDAVRATIRALAPSR